MIGLIVLAVAAAWLVVAARLARYVASKFQLPGLSAFVGVVAFLAFAVLPFADEILGRWQFQRLCASEAVVWVSPNAGAVVAAEDVGTFSERKEFIFPVRQQWAKYADLASGEVFYSVKAFHTPGGFLMRAGLGLGNSTSCWPERWTSKDVGLNIDELLKRGKR